MHYSHNPWVKHKKDKRTPAKTISKRSCAMQRNVVRFKNVPDVSSFTQSTRKRVLEQHHQWSSLLAEQPREALHRSCYVHRDGTIPRQTAAWLVEEYCKKQKVEYQTMFDCITASNGDLEDPKLIANDDAGNAYINLLALDAPTLWRVYQQIPEDHRQAHPPPEPPPQAPRPVGRPRKHFCRQPPPRTLLEPPPPPPEPPPIVEVEVFWACCDKCSKWRRVPAEPEGDYWECSAILISCDQPEDGMDEDEKWTGDVKGEQSSSLPSAVPSAVPSVAPSEQPESQEPVPAPAAEPVDPEDDDVASIDLFGEEDEDVDWENVGADGV